MRETRNLYPPIKFRSKPGQTVLPVWPAGGASISKKKGGDCSCQLSIRLSSKPVRIMKKEMKTSKPQTSGDSHTVNPFIKAAELVCERGQIHPLSDVPTPEEEIGILFNIIRRRKKIDLENLAKRSGYKIEELIAFEAGLLTRLDMCKMLPDLARNVGIAYDHLLQEIKQKNSLSANN